MLKFALLACLLAVAAAAPADVVATKSASTSIVKNENDPLNPNDDTIVKKTNVQETVKSSDGSTTTVDKTVANVYNPANPAFNPYSPFYNPYNLYNPYSWNNIYNPASPYYVNNPASPYYSSNNPLLNPLDPRSPYFNPYNPYNPYSPVKPAPSVTPRAYYAY